MSGYACSDTIAEASYCVTSSLTTCLPKGMSSLFAAGRLVLRFFITPFVLSAYICSVIVCAFSCHQASLQRLP